MMTDDWVVFDKYGNTVALDVPKDVGPAAMLVSDVTDALKLIEANGRVVDSVDRRKMWSVEALALNTIVLRRLEKTEMPVDDLLDAVRAAGFSWQIRPISVP